MPKQGVGWFCGTVLGLWPKDCEFNPGSWQLFGERISSLSLTAAELYGLLQEWLNLLNESHK